MHFYAFELPGGDMNRITSIDLTRGLVMIIMALDHVRDLIHEPALTQSPTNLDTTTPLLFFTRWITYLCAPTFVFLAGTSAYLAFKSDNNPARSRSFLLKRGLYLIGLEFLVVNFLMFFDIGYHTLFFEVIAAIGVGFVLLSFMLSMPVGAIAAVGLLIICCHNLFAFIPFSEGSVLKAILSPLFNLNVYPFSNRIFIIAYPPVPWLGIMLAGFATGNFFERKDISRKKLFLVIGSCALLLFIALRSLNIYGDPLPWSQQRDTIYTFLSWMNVTKYPPSLLFCLITLGIMFLILSIAERAKGWFVDVAIVYGRVPLFYFLAHFFMIHVILLAVLLLQGFHWQELNFASGTFGRPRDVESGLSLWAVYLIWAAVVALMYKPCQWLGKYKAEHKRWLLRYV